MQLVKRIHFDNALEMMKFSQDGSLLLIVTAANEIMIVEVETGERITHWREPKSILDVALSPTNEYALVATEFEVGNVIKYRLPEGDKIDELRAANIVSLAVNPKTDLILGGSPLDRKLRFVAYGHVVFFDQSLTPHSKQRLSWYPSDIVQSDDGGILLFEHGVATIWELSSQGELTMLWDGSHLLHFDTESRCEVTCADLSSDGRYAAIGFWGCQTGSIFLVDTKEGRPVGWLTETFDAGCAAVAVSGSGEYIIGTGTNTSRVYVWHRQSLSVVDIFDISDCRQIAHASSAGRIAFGTPSMVTIRKFTE